MASWRQLGACLFLLELFHWCAISQTAAPPSHTDPAFIKKTVDDHNKYRSQANPTATAMRYMSWDPQLAEIALDWAKGCKFAHNPALKGGGLHPQFAQIGENIWTGFGVAADPTKSWVESEVPYYTFADNSCSKICGHYTQVVWAESYKVGCAAAFCKTVQGAGFSNAILLVCDYGPAGNFGGSRPYKAGASCSECTGGDTCVNKLCTREKRDKVVPYTRPGARKPSIGNTPQAYYGETAFVMLLFHSFVFTLTHFVA